MDGVRLCVTLKAPDSAELLTSSAFLDSASGTLVGSVGWGEVELAGLSTTTSAEVSDTSTVTAASVGLTSSKTGVLGVASVGETAVEEDGDFSLESGLETDLETLRETALPALSFRLVDGLDIVLFIATSLMGSGLVKGLGLGDGRGDLAADILLVAGLAASFPAVGGRGLRLFGGALEVGVVARDPGFEGFKLPEMLSNDTASHAKK